MEYLSIKEGLLYPLKNRKRLWNILWLLVPLLGGFALSGYVKKIVKSMVISPTDGLPEFGSFWDNFVQGIKLFVFFIPTYSVLFAVISIPIFGEYIYFFLALMILPWLSINYFVKDTFYALWDIKVAFKSVFGDLGGYISVFLKSLLYGLIYGLASFLLVGISCSIFGSTIYYADFYRENQQK